MRSSTEQWLRPGSPGSPVGPAGTDPSDLCERRDAGGHRVSVVIPARNEEDTVGPVVRTLRQALVESVPLIDELVVIDSDSSDHTAAAAREAGAQVHAAAAIRPDLGSHPGKGEALWKSLFVTTGDLIVFVDADLLEWGPHYVTGLVEPLLLHPDVALVKGWYDRSFAGEDTGGGRVTELVARPLIDLWWPDLAGLVQPLAGEWAIRRELIERLAVPTGYGVEIAAVLDTYSSLGLQGIAQVDLGRRAHRHHPDRDLALMSAEILAVAASRARGMSPREVVVADRLVQHSRADGWTERAVPLQQRPPWVEAPADPADSAEGLLPGDERMPGEGPR